MIYNHISLSLKEPDKRKLIQNGSEIIISVSLDSANVTTPKNYHQKDEQLLVFGAGVYIGIYADQKYKVPRLDEPQKLIEHLNEWLEQYKKR
ncbi:hypothetical protein LSH36_362g02016 [Paralvinella palmiformis]|uniref:Uncharacterized protein n=1 Tax=Paralvinella palmiformis TaxID=53620 RepID=A0AAD9MZS5_9ANNE|nr:hypothetical protein LSH36_362g02016 [Paralvinella palmiformis]